MISKVDPLSDVKGQPEDDGPWCVADSTWTQLETYPDSALIGSSFDNTRDYLYVKLTT
jgi:hypothetical protein